MVPENLIKEGNFDKIESLAREAMESILDFKLSHVGVNCEDEEAAARTAGEFSKIFNFALNDGYSSIFAKGIIEVMKSPYRGTMGHIAIKTNYIDRAVNYLKYRGCKFDESTAKYHSNGNLKAIYLENEIGGFGIHLVQ